MIAAELELRANDWLAVEPIIEDRVFTDVPFTIFWEGEPGEATAAIAMGSDGVLFASAYIWTPDDPELLIAMVDSIYVPESSFNPDGVS